MAPHGLAWLGPWPPCYVYNDTAVSNHTHQPAARAFRASRSAAEIVVHDMGPEAPDAALVRKTPRIVNVWYRLTSR